MHPGRRPKIRTSEIGTPGRAKGAESVKSPLSDVFGTDDETHTWTEEEALAFLTSEGASQRWENWHPLIRFG